MTKLFSLTVAAALVMPAALAALYLAANIVA